MQIRLGGATVQVVVVGQQCLGWGGFLFMLSVLTIEFRLHDYLAVSSARSRRFAREDRVAHAPQSLYDRRVRGDQREDI